MAGRELAMRYPEDFSTIKTLVEEF